MKKRSNVLDIGGDVEPIVFISDAHAPYEDLGAMSIVDKVIRHVRPRRVVSLGDFADIAQISRHVKDPAMRMPFRKELAGARRSRAKIDDACAAAGVEQKDIVEGNHEDRLRRYILENCPELDGILPKLSELLEFEKNGWRVTEYGDVLTIGSLHITHDLNTAGVYAHERSRVAMGGSTVIGHTHRMAVSYAGTFAAGRHVAAMFGWLGDARYAKYIKRALRPHWQLGFGVGWLDRRTGFVTLQGIPIVQGRAIVQGKVFEAKCRS